MFLSELKVRFERTKNTAVLLSDLIYKTREGLLINVNYGFMTNFSSLPKLLRKIVPVVGKLRYAAVIHDYIYSRNGRIIYPHEGKFSGNNLLTYVPRRKCDIIFLQAMKELKISLITRNFVYLWVRIGGSISWNKYEKAL